MRRAITEVGEAGERHGLDLDPPGRMHFVRRMTGLQRAPLVPEMILHLALEPHRIFKITEELTNPPGEHLPPFWAFAWPGGQGLARHILDNPEVVRGKRVIDIGSGSGIAAIAAVMSGAIDVLAADIDVLSEAAIELNALENGVRVRTTTMDVLSRPPDADLVLIGDLVYEPELAGRVAAFLEAVVGTGAAVLLGDRISARRPPMSFELIAEYEAPVIPELIDDSTERARVWRLVRRIKSTRGKRS